MTKKIEKTFFQRVMQNAVEHIFIIIIMAGLGIGYNWVSGIIDSPTQIKEIKEIIKRDSLTNIYKHKLDSISFKIQIDSLKNQNKYMRINIQKIKEKLKID